MIDGVTGDQRFFLAFGQIWKGKYCDEALLNLIKTNPHSPGQYRANGRCATSMLGTPRSTSSPATLYLPPEQRVRIW